MTFAAVDLSHAGRQTFRFTHLAPPMDYTVGLRASNENRDSSAVVAMTLRNERGEIVFAQKRRLSEWDWIRSLARIDGQSGEVGADGGWGTYFRPRWSGEYTLEVEVVEPDTTSPPRVAPVIEGYVAWM